MGLHGTEYDGFTRTYSPNLFGNVFAMALWRLAGRIIAKTLAWLNLAGCPPTMPHATSGGAGA